ncbi:MAG: hypothetical protein K6F77_01005 [Lachnospiraceae bacterium]|nr:hypothetical protein [Lachnospiraceae bacterium]
MNGYEIIADSYRSLIKKETDEKTKIELEKKIKILDFLATCDAEDKCYLFDSSAFNDIFKGYTNKVVGNLLKNEDINQEQADRLRNSFSSILDEISAEEALKYRKSVNYKEK